MFLTILQVLKEVSKTLFDLKTFKETDPKLYDELFSKYNKPSVANVIDANLIRVK
jgi:exonuclease I